MLDSSYDRRLRRTIELTTGGSPSTSGGATGQMNSSSLAMSITSPTKNRLLPTRNTIGDRLVPTRAGNNWQVAFHMKDEHSGASSLSPAGVRNGARNAAGGAIGTGEGAGAGQTGANGASGANGGTAPGDAAGRDRSLFRSILENEVLNSGIDDPRELQNKKRRVFNVRHEQ